MAVIINELEVVSEAAAKAAGDQTQPAEQPARAASAGPINPQDLADVLRHQADRRARLRAH